ncbi:MAG: transglutaminase-like domain-containing protein [Verrucomicrobiota bacterium]|nr:transglutaminase-like domain-containing protein [Verrucomicrobiota bacterium]
MTLGKRLLCILLLAFLLIGDPCQIWAAPTRLTITEHKSLKTRTDWYGLYIKGTKCGYAAGEFRVPTETTPYYEMDTKFVMQLTSLGQRSKAESRELYRFNGKAPYELVYAESVLTQEGVTTKTTLTGTTSGYKAEVTEGNKTRKLFVGKVDLTVEDLITPEIWCQKKPAKGDSIEIRMFEIDDLKSRIHTYTVKDVREEILQGVKTRILEAGINSSVEGELGDAVFDGEGIPLTMKMGPQFELRLEQEVTAKQIEYSADLFLGGSVEINKPLGGPSSELARLTIEVSGAGVKHLLSGSGQRVTHLPNGTAHVQMTGVDPHTVPVESGEIEKNLEETPEYPIEDPIIKEMAAQGIGTATTTAEKVKNLTHFVSEYIKDTIVTKKVTALEVVQSKEGDCTEHTLLFVTLARAAGIPAREVTGLVYMGDSTRRFGGHAWAEVALNNQWVSADATFDQVPVDGGHFRIDSGPKGLAKTMLVLGDLKFKYISHELGRPGGKSQNLRQGKVETK